MGICVMESPVHAGIEPESETLGHSLQGFSSLPVCQHRGIDEAAHDGSSQEYEEELVHPGLFASLS